MLAVWTTYRKNIVMWLTVFLQALAGKILILTLWDYK